MSVKEFIKKYPYMVVFASLFVAVWVVYGIYQLIYNQNNKQTQDQFEEVAANAFVSANTASDNDLQVGDTNNQDASTNQEEIVEEVVIGPFDASLYQDRLNAFYGEADNKELYSQYVDFVPDFNYLLSCNDEIVAYLLVPETKIDYPILQGAEDGFYLNHNLDKKKSPAGCLYIEKFNEPTMTDPIAAIYGHDMLNDTMFGTLNKYLDANYRNQHKYFFIYTPYEVQIYEVAITSVVEDKHIFLVTDDFVEKDEETMVFKGFRGDEPVVLYNAFVNKTISHSNTYMTKESFTEDDQLMVLSTCFREGTRFVVIGRRVV